jgi:outer membrane receptor protein involved in Fe transport
VGGDLRETTATNHEQGYFPDGRARPPTSTDAFQRTSGIFAQATARPRETLTLTLGARGDLRERDRTSSLGDADANVSPRVTAAWTLTQQIVVRGSAAWSFRAPTLNERFRGFRVGNVLTLPNPDLRPETLRTVEAGVFMAPRHGSVRVTVFRSDLDDGVTNVTLSTTPALTTRQRQNVGGIRVLGLELETDWPLIAGASLTAAAAILDSRFVDDPELTDLRVPQVPRWQASTGVRWLAPADVALAGQLRVFGPQFEDDRNTLTLDGGAVLDVSATRPLGRGVSLLASVENLFDTSYDVGRTPVRTVGLPFTAFAGVRLDLRR